MYDTNWIKSRWCVAIIAASLVAPAMAGRASAGPHCATFVSANAGDEDDKPVAKKKAKPAKKEEAGPKVRWGQKRTESDAEYDKRYGRLLKRIKQDKKGDFSDGTFMNGKDEEARLWTYMGHPFIVRTDISKEFTADTAMYMEMLHREYGRAYSKLLGGVPADVREKIEVIVFSDRSTYMKNGGSPGSGGFFHPIAQMNGDRGPHWPAARYRLQQFTSGITDFRKWEKGTLKHEAAHMELQLRLGNTLLGNQIGFPVDAPRWWNEGHAAVFEYWDFDKTVEENFTEIPNRGRYAPVIRRIVGTKKWKDFDYVWEIDPQSWHRDMTSEQGFLNYAQAWSLAAYMMGGGRQGWKDFRAVFDLSKRVGVDYQTTYKGDRTRAWEEKFPTETKEALEKNWTGWVTENVSRDKAVPDEEYFLKRNGYNPEVVDELVHFSAEEFAGIQKWLDKERERRKKSKEIER